MLQVFYVDRDIESLTGGQVALDFTGIPTGATVLINVTKPDWTIRTTGPSFPDTWTPLRQTMPWNLPNATTPTFGGTAQFMGSVLVGSPTGTTNVVAPGMNGRFFTTGAVVHGGPGGGSGNEFHSCPFDGDLPTCRQPTESPTASPTESPTAGPTASPPTSPTTSPTGPTTTPTHPLPTTPSKGPVLPTTGVRLWIGIMSALGPCLAGIGVLAMIRSRRHE